MATQKDNTFTIVFDRWYQGFAPMAQSYNLTALGNAGMASSMTNVDILAPDYITQGSSSTPLTNGTEAGVVSELITFILDKATSDDVSYAIGATKLFKLSSTTVASGGSPSFPQVITNCTDGKSLVDMGGNLYGFYNTSSAGDILKMPLATEVIDPDWGSTIPTGKATLQKAVHPVAVKEDIIAFGNGQYMGTYVGDTDTLAPTKLDFKSGNIVSDVVFHANQWWIAVNSGVSGTNRNYGHIFIYDGSATESILADETSIGVQRIGFLYALNGIVYVAYQDLSSTAGYKIGYIIGRQIKPLGYFSGSLPTFAQKTLYKNTILFISNHLVYSAGAVIEELPIQISQYMDGGYSTVGAIACPFGEILIASSQSTSYKLAKADGYDTNSNWKSIIIPLISGRMLGYIDEIICLTNTLAANARCDLVLEYNQNSSNSGTAKQITGTGLRRFVFNIGSGSIEDFRLYLNWANGNTTNDCPIRKIEVRGHFVEK